MKKISNEFFKILRSACTVSAILKLISIPFGIINAALLADAVNFARSGDYVNVLITGGTLLIILLIVKIFELISGYMLKNKVSNSVQQCKMLLYKRFLSGQLNVLYRSSAGDAKVLLHSDFQTVTNRFTSVSPTLIASTVTVIAYLIYLCTTSPLIGGIVLLISILQILPPLFVKFFCEKLDVDDKDMEGQITNCALECYDGFSTIKLFGIGKWCLMRMKSLHQKMWGIANRLQATYRAETALSGTISKVLTYGTYAIVGILIASERVSIDIGLQAIALSGSFYSAVNSVFGQIPKYALACVAEKRMMNFWSTSDSVSEKMLISSDIYFRDVSCSFKDKKVLCDVNFDILENSLSVFKGENGSGKSTAAKLMLGMLECDKGNITIGGSSPKELAKQNFPHRIFYLPQEDAIYNLTPTELFDAILKENSYVVYEYLRQFDLNDAICSQTIGSLSGGERKKIFLSLSFAISPRVLILDEPTNSLDLRGKEILNALLKKRIYTTIVITHEEDLMQIASKVLVFKKGEVAYEK